MKTRLHRLTLRVLVFAALAATPVGSAFAQTSMGGVSGTVTDSTGAVVPGASVTLVNEATDVRSVRQTNANGFFTFVKVRPGRYALTFRIEYRPDQPAEAPPRDEWAFVLAELGAQPQPALAVRIEPLTLDVAGTANVVLESADGAAHRAGVRVLLPSGVNVLEAPLEADVPAAGEVRVPVRLVRGDAPRGRPHAMIVIAGPVDGPLERASVAKGEIQIASDPAWLPRLRPGLAALGALLLLAAIALELRARRNPRP